MDGGYGFFTIDLTRKASDGKYRDRIKDFLKVKIITAVLWILPIEAIIPIINGLENSIDVLTFTNFWLVLW